MQQTPQAPTENAALEAWQAFLAKHPRLRNGLAIISSVTGYFLNGHAVVALVRWLVTVAGRIAESALLLATLYVTLNNVAHQLLVWIVPTQGIEFLNYLSVVAFSILPELIVGIAITTTYNHWNLFVRSPRWKNSAWVWGTLYLIPTSVFTVMTITTLASFVQIVAASGHPGQATGTTLTVRFLAGWSYSLIEILFVTIGKKSYAERFDRLRLTIAELRAQATHLQEQMASQAMQWQAKLQEQATQLQALQATLETERATWQEERQAMQSRRDELSRRSARGLARARVTLTNLEETEEATPQAGLVTVDDGASMTISDGERTVTVSGNYYELIKAAMLETLQSGEPLDYKAIAQKLSIGYSTVRKWGQPIKAELAREATGPHSFQD